MNDKDKKELINECGRPLTRPLGILQGGFLLTFVSSFLVWIWADWNIAWKVGLTGILGAIICGLLAAGRKKDCQNTRRRKIKEMKQKLIFDADTEQKLRALAQHAEKNPFSMDDLLDIYNKQAPVAGLYDEFTLRIPVGFRVVFSIEKQLKDVRHLSISVNDGLELPHPFFVEEIMKHLGFKNDLRNIKDVKIESIGEGRSAINIWEQVE